MCEEVGPGELVQLLCALKMSTTPTPSRTLVKFEVPKLVDVPKGAAGGGQDEEMVTVKQENQRSMKVQFTTTKGRGEYKYIVEIAKSPLWLQKGEWNLTSGLSTQRRPWCALSATSQHIIMILSTNMYGNTTKALFKWAN